MNKPPIRYYGGRGPRKENAMRRQLRRRPTEALTGLALAGAILGFLVEAGVGQPLAGGIAVAIAFVPGAISSIVDQVRRERLSKRRIPDRVEGGPAADR